MRKFYLFPFLAGLLLSSAAHAASFDCGHARAILEVLICADAELSDLDSQVGEVYSHVRKEIPKSNLESAELLSAQREFLKERN
jgi:uncharacterized protein